MRLHQSIRSRSSFWILRGVYWSQAGREDGNPSLVNPSPKGYCMPSTAPENSTHSRRRCVGTAIATAASYGRILGAKDRIRIAGIGTGGRYSYLLGIVKDMPARATVLLQQRQTHETMSAALSCPGGVVEFDSALLGYIEGGGLMYRSTKGAMRLHRAGFEVYNELPSYSEAFQAPPAVLKASSKREGTIDHMQNFLDCLRSRNAPNALVEVGVEAARAGHVANLALRGNGVWNEL